MELFIRIKDGQPFEHPILSNNFCLAFPNVDTNNLPTEFARFIRIQPPQVGPYEKNQTVSYQLVDGVYTDVFLVEQMTVDEKLAKQEHIKSQWLIAPNWASWTFDETTCQYEPPVLRPSDGKMYGWDELTTSWIEIVS
jgi:hypothetical protein